MNRPTRRYSDVTEAVIGFLAIAWMFSIAWLALAILG